MDAVKELELSLKEIAKWEAFETRRKAALARRKNRSKLAADVRWTQRKETPLPSGRSQRSASRWRCG